MAGRPPAVTQSYEGREAVLSFNVGNTLKFEDVKACFTALQRKDLFGADATIVLDNGRVFVTVPRPAHIANSRSKHFGPWIDKLKPLVRAMITTMYTLQQAGRLHCTGELLAQVREKLQAT